MSATRHRTLSAPAPERHAGQRPAVAGQRWGPSLPALQRLAGNRAVQRFVELRSHGPYWLPEENGSAPVGYVSVFGAWRQFSYERWNRDSQYQAWVYDGWNQPANVTNARPEPPSPAPVSAVPQFSAEVLAQIQLHLQMQLAMQMQNLLQVPTPQQAPALTVQAPPAFTIRSVGDADAPDVLAEVNLWSSYVDQAIKENPSDKEVVWQLQSSKTVLESIASNLGEMIDEGEDDHDFDIAVSADGAIQAVIDTTAEDELQIENLATNPRNLYTLQGARPAGVKGAGRSLIAQIVREADARSHQIVRLVALTQDHVVRYQKQGFAVDIAQLDQGKVPEREIPMVGKLADLKAHFL